MDLRGETSDSVRVKNWQEVGGYVMRAGGGGGGGGGRGGGREKEVMIPG